MATTRFDFTEGSIPKKMLLFSAPLLLSNALQTSYQFIDSLWVGNLLGSQALAALSISGPLIFTMLSFILGVNGATMTVLSQKKGADDWEGLKESLNSFVFVLALLAIVFGAIGLIFAPQFLHLMGAPQAILPLATLYIRINFTGILFLFGYNFISSVLRALGDSRTPIQFVAVAVVLNTIINPLLIKEGGLGISGAALSTVISQGVAFFYGLIYSIKRANVPFSMPRIPSLSQIKLISKLGLPSGLQMMAISAGSAAITSVAARFGSSVLAGFGASQRINNLIMMPIQTLGTASQSMAGQNIGSKSWKRVGHIAKTGLIFVLSISLAIGCLTFFFSHDIIRWFTSDPKALKFGSIYLKGIAFFYLFLGINFVLNAIMRAAGAMFQVLILNLISFWILRVPLTNLTAHLWGSNGIAIGIGLSFVLSSGFSIGYYLKGRWREIDLFNDASKRIKDNRH